MHAETTEVKSQYNVMGIGLGLRKESETIKPAAVLGFMTLARIDSWRHKTQFEGSLPQDGAGIIVGNHSSSRDVLRIIEAGRRTAGRWIIGMAKEPLLHPEVQEPQEVIDRTGREDTLPLPLKKIRAWFMRGVGNIAVKRGGRNMEAIREAGKRLRNRMLVGIFLQETRVKEGDLRNLMNGAAFLAQLNPDIKIIPVGFSKEEVKDKIGKKTRFIDRVRIGEAFTYNDIINDPTLPPIESIQDFTVIIAERIAKLLPKDKQDDWKERRLDYEYGRKLAAAEIQISSN